LGRLKGKTCVVTGAGQGIGRAIAEAFRQAGATTVAVDKNGDAVAEWTDGTGIRPLATDVTDPSAVAALAAEAGAADVLVNCVGIVPQGSLLDCTYDELQTAFRINVGSIHLVTSAFLPGMLKVGSGSVINIASVVSTVMAAPDRYAYATTKAAIIGLTKAIARDYIASGIRCNSISPGTVESPSLEQRIMSAEDPEKARAAFIARQPMGRVGWPSEIAQVAVLLASDEARYLTGENIVIDGGMSL
jgi:2-keto-3-deoxy-L-fuconate dehydrogenase